MRMKHTYKFSIVMAIYNMEEYLEEAILSVINQDIGFEENVQLILVNDGSIDKSDIICKKYKALYPKNIIYIEKENGGVSSARNKGMKFIEGKYMNFLDADDKLSLDTLKKVYDFFEKEYDKVNIVSIPVEFFEGKNGNHILNYKYKAGTRVVDLNKEYEMIQLSSSSAFFKSYLKDEFKFNLKMKYAEDAEMINKILLKTNTLGVVSDCKYLYRFRNQISSATQTGDKKKEWYLDYIKSFSLNLIDYCVTIKGNIPEFIQFTIMYDLQWRINNFKHIKGILDEQEIKEFFYAFTSIVTKINSNILMKQKSIKLHRKLMILGIMFINIKNINNIFESILIKF
jgi:glycosyltransferase involved in cell wall biosynthesis